MDNEIKDRLHLPYETDQQNKVKNLVPLVPMYI
jgi:hypothetical protein